MISGHMRRVHASRKDLSAFITSRPFNGIRVLKNALGLLMKVVDWSTSGKLPGGLLRARNSASTRSGPKEGSGER